MSKAKITKPEGYTCCPDGHTKTTFQAGTIVDGQVAEWALQDRAASAMFDPRDTTKVQAAPETKVASKRRSRKPK